MPSDPNSDMRKIARLRKIIELPFLGMILGTLATPPAHAVPWVLRPGLWEEVTAQDIGSRPFPRSLPRDQSAALAAMLEISKTPRIRQVCQPAASNAVEGIFSPYQYPDLCAEKVLTETKAAREIENRCKLKLAGGVERPGRALRHVILLGDGAGTIDRIELEGGAPGDRLSIKLRWLKAAC